MVWFDDAMQACEVFADAEKPNRMLMPMDAYRAFRAAGRAEQATAEHERQRAIEAAKPPPNRKQRRAAAKRMKSRAANAPGGQVGGMR
jgi:hypothetical protein